MPLDVLVVALAPAIVADSKPNEKMRQGKLFENGGSRILRSRALSSETS